MKLAERTMDYRLLAQLNEGKWPTACTSPSKISVGGLLNRSLLLFAELLPIPRKKSLQRFLEKRQQR